MLNKISSIVCLIVLMFGALMSGSVYADRLNAEASGGVYRVSGVDTKAQVLKISGFEIAYNALTVVYDKSLKKVSISDLESAKAVQVYFNPSERYITRPTATKIYIK